MSTSGIWRELRGALRGLRQARVITASAILCLAVGIGATLVVFSAVDRALLQPLPFHEPARLVSVFRTTPYFDRGPFSAPNYADLAAGVTQLDGLAALTPQGGLLAAGDGTMEVAVVRATGNLFQTLGVQPRLGRLLTPADDEPGAPGTIVLAEELWRERFGADPALVGRTVRFDGEPRTVVGIAPRDLQVPHGGMTLAGQVWIPMQFAEGERAARGSNFVFLLGRLAPTATVDGAQRELETLTRALVDAHPELEGEGTRALGMQGESVRGLRTPLLLVLGAVGLVLLIAVTNVAALLLARGVHRRRELAIRTALGGTRADVMRPVLVESLLLTVIGVACGAALASLGATAVESLAAAQIPQLAGFGIDWRALAVAALLAVVVAVLCGLVPAWRGTRVAPQDALRSGRIGAGREQHRALGALVIAEVALALVLLLGTGLTLQGFRSLLAREPGFDPSPVLTLRATVSPVQYPERTAVTRFVEPALEAVRAIPGVEAAGAISQLPYRSWGWNFGIAYEGRSPDAEQPLVEARSVSPEFFAVTRQRLLDGRLLTAGDDDRPGAPEVVVVNEALVRRDFPDGSPIGRRFHTGDTTFATIVGVVSDIRNFGPVEAPTPEVYGTLRQRGWGASFPIAIRVRDGDDPTRVAAAVQAAIRSVDPEAAVSEVQPMQAVIDQSVGRPRFFLVLLAGFGLVAVLLAVAGIYGVLSYATAQRTREYGIRAALGASTTRTFGHVLGAGGRLVGTGVALGLLGGVAASRLLEGFLFGVSRLDLVAWLGAVALMLAAGVAAMLVPARRAMRADPLVAMRAE